MEKVLTFSVLAVKILERSYPGIRSGGLKTELRKYLRPIVLAKSDDAFDDPGEISDAERDEYVEDRIEELLRDATFNPDAFKLNAQDAELLLFEIEDTNPLTLEKLHLIISTRAALAEVDLETKLFIVDRYATRVTALDLDVYESLLYPYVPRELPKR